MFKIIQMILKQSVLLQKLLFKLQKIVVKECFANKHYPIQETCNKLFLVEII